MKKQLFTLLLLCIAGSSAVNAQSRSMAKAGDEVWILLNSVKADKRQQFEQFLHEVFWPGASKLSPDEQRVFKQTRILHPTEPESDGTYACFFIMDPVIKGGNYDILSLLTKMYGEAKAKDYYATYEASLNSPQKGYTVTQSKY